MNTITRYRQTHGLSQSGFASLIAQHGPGATQALISQWENGQALVPPDRCPAIEAATGGQIRADELRPDVVWQRDPEGRVTGYLVEIAAGDALVQAPAASGIAIKARAKR